MKYIIFSSSFSFKRKQQGDWGVWDEGCIPDSSRKEEVTHKLTPTDKKHQPSEDSELGCSMAGKISNLKIEFSHKRGIQRKFKMAGAYNLKWRVQI